MEHDYDKLLEAEIDRELKGLPDLQAPPGIAMAVMQRIGRRANLPWYRQAWPAWPPMLRFASLLLLLAMCGGLYFGVMSLLQLDAVEAGRRQLANLVSGAGALFNAAHVVLVALTLAFKQLGTAGIIGIGLALALGYAVCMGLGTLSLRLVYARR